MDDCVDRVGSAKYVSKVDLLKGYWQIPMSSRAREVSAFATPDGLWQYKVMAFGLKNAPASFQRLMNRLTQDLDGCHVYLDDIVLCSQTWDSHIAQVRSLFSKLSEANLTVNLKKSGFGQATIEYLGHVVGQGRVRPVEAKVEAIQNLPSPKNRREVQRYLGMVGYYRKFCKNFADIVLPLTDLTKQNMPFVWSEDCQRAFDSIKAIMSSHPVLMSPNFDLKFSLAVDSSDRAAGAVLLQSDSQGIDHPVCYFSKKYDKHQQRYATVEKEALALMLALQHFEVYLAVTSDPVTVYTDHNPLTFINRLKTKNQRLLRWSLILQEYNLEIVHIKGIDNVLADVLSRSF